MTNFVPFQRMALIGAGLINGSLARAVRDRGLAKTTIAHSRTQATRDRVRELGFVDDVTDSLEDAVRNADVVVLGTPVAAFAEIAAEMGPHLAPGAIVTDVGSVKRAVVEAVSPHLPEGTSLVPGHPIAGTEHSGPDSGFAELFDGRWCVLTPPPGTNPAARERITGLWQAVGMRVDEMTPEHHDLVLAITSHVPHLIAFSIVGTVTTLEEQLQSEVMKYAAGGFRDFTRIAASDPAMWRDVFLANKDAVLEMTDRAGADLEALRRMIREEDGEGLTRLITRTRDVRRGVIAFQQD